MSVDRKFAVLRPSLDRLVRAPLEVANTALLNPVSTSPLAMVDGELVQLDSTGKYIRATDATKPSFFVIDERGDYGVQASRKLTAIMCGSYLADTVLFDPALTTWGVALKMGVVSIESQNRACLIAQGGSGIILGYVMKVASANGGKLQFINTFA